MWTDGRQHAFAALVKFSYGWLFVEDRQNQTQHGPATLVFLHLFLSSGIKQVIKSNKEHYQF
jgi:hypothetical protein